MNDPRVLTDVGDVPIQEIRDCGVDDDRLMNIISESVKLVMEEVVCSKLPCPQPASFVARSSLSIMIFV